MVGLVILKKVFKKMAIIYIGRLKKPKYGYKPDMKHKSLIILLYFWLLTECHIKKSGNLYQGFIYLFIHFWQLKSVFFLGVIFLVIFFEPKKYDLDTYKESRVYFL